MPSVQPAHTRSLDELFLSLKASATGLTQAEAAARLQAGKNELPSPAGVPRWRLLARQFGSVLILILLVAAVLSAVMGELVEASAIIVIVLLAGLMGFLQEVQAGKALDALRRLASPQTTALRDGAPRSIPSADVVRGDVILLKTGDAVPADARVLESLSLRMNEAALTGESDFVEKSVSRLEDPGIVTADQVNMVFGGTTVQAGRGSALVVETGAHTEIGRIAALLQSTESRPTPLQENLDRLGKYLGVFSLLLAIAMSLLGVLRGYGIFEMFVWGVAIAVAVIPEALPAVVTITLALGVRKMARQRALIRNLPAVETLGATSVICSDKTGTLTQNEMTARTLVVGGRVMDVSTVDKGPGGSFLAAGQSVDPQADPAMQRLLLVVSLCNDVAIRDDAAVGTPATGNPTETALYALAVKGGIGMRTVRASYPRTAEFPFSSERKRMTTVHRSPEGFLSCMKGAPEVVLAACTHAFTPHGSVPLNDPDREKILHLARAQGDLALRVIATAARMVSSGNPDPNEAESGLEFLGLIGMQDPPRPEVAEAIRICDAAGIRPVMMTGDHKATASAVARELHILRNGEVLTGSDLVLLTDEELRMRVNSVDVYARISPEHKLRIVNAFLENGHVVAMTGDGVNDAPALKRADIGVAMGITGTDVSKEAADMILTDDNFATIVHAVREGRSIFENIRKYLVFLFSGNMGAVCALVLALFSGLPLPLMAVQVLFINFIMDGLIAIVLGVEPPEPRIMQRRPRPRSEGMLNAEALWFIGVMGAWIGLSTFAVFVYVLHRGDSPQQAMAIFFAAIIGARLMNALNCRTLRDSFFTAGKMPNISLRWSMLATIALTATVVYVPVLNKPFATLPLGLSDLALVAAASSTVLMVGELYKAVARRRTLAA